jgi:hypothetical protein
MYRLRADQYVGIVQDDYQDLAQEVANQAKIYQNGVVTILAGGAASANQGFLHRQPKPRSLYNLCIQMPNNKKVCLQLEIRSKDESDQRDPSSYVRDPVNSRAWIFQEGTQIHYTLDKHIIDM